MTRRSTACLEKTLEIRDVFADRTPILFGECVGAGIDQAHPPLRHSCIEFRADAQRDDVVGRATRSLAASAGVVGVLDDPAAFAFALEDARHRTSSFAMRDAAAPCRSSLRRSWARSRKACGLKPLAYFLPDVRRSSL